MNSEIVNNNSSNNSQDELPVTSTSLSQIENPAIQKVEPAIISSTASSKVIYDSNANIVPWISLFGIVTIIACTVIFFVLYKNKQL